MNQRKLQLATDYYQFSVSSVYFARGMASDIAVFDLFIRSNPFKGGYTVFAGLENIVSYILDLRFGPEDTAMLAANHPELDAGFLEYLRNFRFTGDIWAAPEGTIVFPHEPLVRVRAPIIQAQIVETALLSVVNHESLIATKASRVTSAASGKPVVDFGLRRAHGTESGLFGARAAMIGGAVGTSNVEAEARYGATAKGTISHAFVMSFDSELEAFRAYAFANPKNATLLVDTYDTLASGVPNAVRVFDELRDAGLLTGSYGIRLDSGDLAYLSKKSREALDAAGHTGALITASNDLDEYLISDLRAQGAAIDLWGVGTKMITAYDCPALGAVYKLSQIERDGARIPKMKLSDDPFKITNPCAKKVVRLIDRASGKAAADLICLEDETFPDDEPLRIFHPYFPYKQRVVSGFKTREVLERVIEGGELVMKLPGLDECRERHAAQKELFWDEFMRFSNPHEYHVDLSDRLYDIKKELIMASRPHRENA